MHLPHSSHVICQADCKDNTEYIEEQLYTVGACTFWVVAVRAI